MPTSADEPELLVDTSVAVALPVADHPGRAAGLSVVRGRRVGHAAFEIYSVLTRLPPPARRTPAAVARVLTTNFPHTRYLPVEAAADLVGRLSAAAIAGGSVYDGLVGTAAVVAGVPLVTRDRRALGTYRALGVQVVLVG